MSLPHLPSLPGGAEEPPDVQAALANFEESSLDDQVRILAEIEAELRASLAHRENS
ncbi:MAG: hypothetical protein Q4C87_04460 [Actinomycetaceae bacterium]|nr:hypothetical protein [Actinomycetaceae bacterium]